MAVSNDIAKAMAGMPNGETKTINGTKYQMVNGTPTVYSAAANGRGSSGSSGSSGGSSGRSSGSVSGGAGINWSSSGGGSSGGSGGSGGSSAAQSAANPYTITTEAGDALYRQLRQNGGSVTATDGSVWTMNADGSVTARGTGQYGPYEATVVNLYQAPTQDADSAQQIATPNAQEQSSYDLTEYIRQQNARNLEAELASLRAAYEKGMRGYDDHLALLPQSYNAIRNTTAGQDALARRQFDERAVAAGLGNGVSGQMELSRSAALQNALAAIDLQEQNAVDNVNSQKQSLQSEYEAAITQATASGNASLAQALYNELVRIQNVQQQEAQRLQEQQKELATLAAKWDDLSKLKELGINTDSAEAQLAAQQQMAAQQASAYQPTFTWAQVKAAKDEADKLGTTLVGNQLRDYNYYLYGDPDYGTQGAPAGGVSAVSGGGGKTVEELAREVLAGKWGNGEARKAALTGAGYDAAAVQAAVNAALSSGASAPVGAGRDVAAESAMLLWELRNDQTGGATPAALAAKIQTWRSTGKIDDAQADYLLTYFGY